MLKTYGYYFMINEGFNIIKVYSVEYANCSAIFAYILYRLTDNQPLYVYYIFSSGYVSVCVCQVQKHSLVSGGRGGGGA